MRRRILLRAQDHCEWCDRFCGRPWHDPDVWCGREDCAWCRFYFDTDGNDADRERQTLEIHHKTYERLGHELDEDLVALCWTCHDGVTERTMDLQQLAKAGRLSRSDATPQVAATSFWRTFLRGLGLRR